VSSLMITHDSSVSTSEMLSSFIRSSLTFSHYPVAQNTRLPTMEEEKEKVSWSKQRKMK